MRTKFAVLAVVLVLSFAMQTQSAEPDRPIAPPMGIGLAGVASYSPTWQFVDMMKYSREWRTQKDWQSWTIVEDAFGWPVSLKHKDGKVDEIDKDNPIFMYMYYRRISGDVAVTWEGDGDVALSGDLITLKQDDLPGKKRRVFTVKENKGGVYTLNVARSNPKDHVRNIRIWMPGFENADATFHPEWKKCIEPFPYFRFMDWGHTNNSPQKDWNGRITKQHMRQTRGVSYDYMIQLCNEMEKDAWICVPHQATDDYVRELARLLKKDLKPGLRVYVEYSNEIWNGGFRQTHWLYAKAQEEIDAKGLKDANGRPLKKWEHASTLCGRRSAEIWAIVANELGDPDRMIRTITHFRWLDKVMAAALDKTNGEGRVDLIALNGYFISQASLTYALRDLDNWDIDEAMDVLEQQHLLGTAMGWKREIGSVKRQWPDIPITCYEGGQHFANPFSSSLQGKKLTARMIEINGEPRIRNIYRTALETWRLAGGTGFTPFVECGPWGKYGCWGHLEYVGQPLEDVVDPATGEVTERGAHKYAALLDYIERRADQIPGAAPTITTAALPDAAVGKPYEMQLVATGGAAPYKWSLLGGRLPTGLKITPDGKIAGTPTKAEQLVCIVDCTDSKNQHAAQVFGLFIDPSAGVKMESFDFAAGTPAGWKFTKGEGKIVAGKVAAGGIPYYPPSATKNAAGKLVDSDYTVEVVLLKTAKGNQYQALGFAFNLSPDGDKADYLRVYIDGLGHKMKICSRYVKGGKGELWGPREFRLLPDADDGEKDPALDIGEAWTIRASVRPGASPGAIDVLVSVFDQDGKPRLDGTGRNDVANGMLLMRELAIKDALRQGPVGLLTSGSTIKSVRWLKPEAK
jgi:putative Ig domain-containing protein